MYKHLPKHVRRRSRPCRFLSRFSPPRRTSRSRHHPPHQMLIVCSPNNPTGITLTQSRTRTPLAASPRNTTSWSSATKSTMPSATQPAPLHRPAPPRTMHPAQRLFQNLRHDRLASRLRRRPGAAKAVLEQMTKLQQYTFVCAPLHGPIRRPRNPPRPGVDMTTHIDAYRTQTRPRRQRPQRPLRNQPPRRRFYVFPKVPGNGKSRPPQFVAQSHRTQRPVHPRQRFLQPRHPFPHQLRHHRRQTRRWLPHPLLLVLLLPPISATAATARQTCPPFAVSPPFPYLLLSTPAE